MALSGLLFLQGAVPVPVLWPSGSGVQIEYLDSVVSSRQFESRRNPFQKLLSFLAGPPRSRSSRLVHPAGVMVDGRGRVLVCDPGLPGLHIFDLERRKHRVARGPRKQRLLSPVGVAEVGNGRIYVTDSALGKIFVFSSKGHFQRFLGESKGEGFFKRPTGIDIDASSGHIYLTDTLRHRVYVMDEKGKVLRFWGQRGTDPGQFNYPVNLKILGDRVYVLDSLNFRVQVFSKAGGFLFSFGGPGLSPGQFARPRGLAVDPGKGVLYVVDSLTDIVQAFSGEGDLLFAFGGSGRRPGRFQMATDICVDGSSQVLVADSFNRRVQRFRHNWSRNPVGGGR